MARFFAHLRQNRVSLFFFLTALLALVACALRTLAFLIGFDAEIGYFRSASLPIVLANACLILCAVPCVAISFLINREQIPTESKPLCSPRFISAASVAALTCLAAFFLILRADDIPAPKMLVLLAAVLLIGTAAYFLRRLYGVATNSVAALGFFTIFGAAFTLAITYFDRYTQMNAPHKISLHLCMLAIMFAMLYELRALLGRPTTRAYVGVTAFAAVLCAVFSVSNIIALFANVYSSALYLVFDLVALGYAAYFITKSIHLAVAFAKADTEVEE